MLLLKRLLCLSAALATVVASPIGPASAATTITTDLLPQQQLSPQIILATTDLARQTEAEAGMYWL